jgi:hypothetical protein
MPASRRRGVEESSRTTGGWKRRLQFLGIMGLLMVVLAGCVPSPEAMRLPGQAGADVGNHGNPIQLIAPPDRVERVYYDIPYDGPHVAKPDTLQS